jgi:probable HAF family extracellular repeat protein
MKKLILTAAIASAIIAFSFPLVSQEKTAKVYHHYVVINMGTFGGPNSRINGFEYSGSVENINNAGTLIGWADTAMQDPNQFLGNQYGNFCFDDDCYVNHAFQSQNNSLSDLGTLPGGLNSATSWISANGLIAGTSQNGETDPLDAGFPEDQAVFWKDGIITDLGTLPEGGFESGSQAINSHSQVVGWAFNTVPDLNSMGLWSSLFNFYEPIYPYQMRAFLWENGAMKDLGALGTGTDAFAMGINEKGQVMGISYTNATPNQVITGCSFGGPIPTQDPFLWENGKMIDLGTLGGTCGFPYWINDNGQVVGSSDLAGDLASHPFLWSHSHGMQDLGTLGGTSGSASMINEAGVVVGGALLEGDTLLHAFVWNGTMQDIGALDGCAYAFSINAGGQVVGNSGVGCNTKSFIWQSGAPMVDLNILLSSSSGLVVTGAININDGGEIAGLAGDASGNSYAALLIPCDANHPGVAGCNYGTVDADSVAANHPVQIAESSAAAAVPATLSPSEIIRRYRSRVAIRRRMLATPTTAPIPEPTHFN